MHDQEQLAAHVERIRTSGVLGRSAQMRRLFDFLVTCAEAGRVPKEVEIAIDAFGRTATFDVAQDSVVRVYIHKLRQRLDAFYASDGSEETQRLALPKGEYRLTLEAREAGGAAAEAPRRWFPARQMWFAGLLAVSVLVNALLVFMPAHSDVSSDVLRARASPIWAPLLDDDLPILIVIGDYYIVGESSGPSAEIDRLVREFSINSRLELSQYKEMHPESAGRYTDLDLSYLPTAIGPALRELMPLLAVPKKRVRVVTTSKLTADEFRQSHIVYLGYLSGLGMLSDIVLSGSRYAIGSSYDEIVDRESGRRYYSEAGYYTERGDAKYKDYGYFSTFPGSAGNRIVVIAGTRDAALINTSEVAAHPDSLQRLTQQASDTTAFEALYEVFGVEGANVDSKLLGATPLDTAAIWGTR